MSDNKIYWNESQKMERAPTVQDVKERRAHYSISTELYENCGVEVRDGEIVFFGRSVKQ